MSLTKSKLETLRQELDDLICYWDVRIEIAAKTHAELIRKTLEAQRMALTFKTPVGAAVETYDGKFFLGANMENITRSGDDHAEKVAIATALRAGYTKNDLMALALVYESKIPSRPDIEGQYAYPVCGYCRQFAWENAHPNLQIITIDPNGVVTCVAPLKILYPLPYPAKIYERLDLRK